MREAAFEADGEWQAAHAALVELARSRASLDFEEGRWLLAARRAEAHRRLGYASFGEYIERLFGYAPRLTHDKLRVAVALEGLPDLALALREARLSFCQVRELTRVATPETEMIWLKSAQGRTAREVEKLVSGRRAPFPFSSFRLTWALGSSCASQRAIATVVAATSTSSPSASCVARWQASQTLSASAAGSRPSASVSGATRTRLW